MIKPTITKKDMEKSKFIVLGKDLTEYDHKMNRKRNVHMAEKRNDKWYLDTLQKNITKTKGSFSDANIQKYFNTILDKWDEKNTGYLIGISNGHTVFKRIRSFNGKRYIVK